MDRGKFFEKIKESEKIRMSKRNDRSFSISRLQSEKLGYRKFFV